MRGYDPEEVDHAWAEVQNNLSEANASNRELRLQMNSLREQNAEWGNRLKSYEKMEKDLRDALLSAQRIANQVKDDAERASQQLLENAKAEAETIIDETERQAEQRVAELNQEKEQAQELLSRLAENISELTLQKEHMEERVTKAFNQLEMLRETLQF